jgi:hypothetical protein
MKKIAVYILICFIVLLALSTSGCTDDDSNGSKKEFYTAKEFFDDYDIDNMHFRSFKKGDTLKIKDVLNGIDNKDEEKDVFPFHLETEKDTTYYTFFAYIRVENGTTVEYVFSSTENVSQVAEVGDILVINIKIIKQNDMEQFESPIDIGEIIKEP